MPTMLSRIACAANHCSKVAEANAHLRPVVTTSGEARIIAAVSAAVMLAGSIAPPVRMVSTARARNSGNKLYFSRETTSATTRSMISGIPVAPSAAVVCWATSSAKSGRVTAVWLWPQVGDGGAGDGRHEPARLLLSQKWGLDEDVVVDELGVACGQQDPRCRPFLDELAGLARQGGGFVGVLVEAVDDDVDAVPRQCGQPDLGENVRFERGS